MHRLLERYFFINLKAKLSEVTSFGAAELTGWVLNLVSDPEFTALYAQRTHAFPDLGLGPSVNILWSKAMSAQTAAFAAAVANLKTQLGVSGLSADQVDVHVHAIVDPLTAKISEIAASSADAETKVSQIQTELDGFSAAFAPKGGSSASGTSSASGASAGTPAGSSPQQAA